MKKSALKLAIAAAMFASAGAMAANDGLLNTTSTGDVMVQVSKGSVVQISGLADLPLGNFTDVSLATAGGASASDTACVFTSVGTYHATLTSANGAGFVPSVPLVVGTCPDPTLNGNPAFCDGADVPADGSAAVPAVSGTFLMGNGAGAFVTYDATFNAVSADGQAQGPYAGNSVDPTCVGYTLNNSTVGASINSTALVGKPDGNYADVLTILISPN